MKNRLTEYIPIEECKSGHLYRIHSRNLDYGVYKNSDQGFIGLRTKFGSRFLFTEYHWDTGSPFGTVKPVTEVMECPIKDLNEEDNFELHRWFKERTWLNDKTG